MEEQLSKKEQKAMKKEQMDKEARKKSAMTWVVGGAVGIIILFGLFSLFSGDKTTTNTNPTGKVDQAVTKDDHIKGNFDAPVTLIEYSDLQCPACGSYYPIVKQLGEEFPDALRIVYRHFPLRRIHPNAANAARAVEAANLQGKFWEMHDILFENQNFWGDARNPKDDFLTYAGNIGLDVQQFEEDYDNNSSLDDLVRDDELRANALGLNSTPSFVLNGEKITNPRSLNEFIELIKKNIPSDFNASDDSSNDTSTDADIDPQDPANK